MYLYYVQTEMLAFHPHLQYFNGVFLDWVESIVTKLDNYNERESGSVVLYIKNLDVNVRKLKKIF